MRRGVTMVLIAVLVAIATVAQPRLPTARAAEGDPIYMIGDSLTFAAWPVLGDRLAEAGWTSSRISAGAGREVDHKITADSDTGLTAVGQLRREFGAATNWIIALGTNDALYSDPANYLTNIRRMMDEIGSGNAVMWVNIHLPGLPERQHQWNDALEQVADERGGDLTVFDWARVSAAHPQWFDTDLVHHNVEGIEAFGTAIAEASRGLLRPARRTPVAGAAPIGVGVGGGFIPLPPTRVLDTRETGPARGVAAGSLTRIDVSAVVPAGATAVVANVTAVGYAHSGYASATACSADPTATSTVNFDGSSGPAQSTAAVVALDEERAVCVYSSAPTHLVVDVFGAFVSGAGLPMDVAEPTRLADTRLTAAPVLPAGSVLRLAAPDGAQAVMVNLTVDEIAGEGYLEAWPCSASRPLASNLNYAPSERQKANAAIVSIGGDGMMCVFNSAPVAVIVDLMASFSPDGHNLFHPTPSRRVLDTRSGFGGWAGLMAARQRLTVNTPELPVGAIAVATVTATDSVSSGYATVWSGGDPLPPTSTLNHTHGITRSNLVVVSRPADNTFTVANGPRGRVDLVVDLIGFFAP